MEKEKLYRTAAYYLTFVVVGITTASFGPSIPSFAASTSAGIRSVSALFTLHRAGYMVGSILGGQLHERLAGNLLTAFTLLIIGLGLAAVSLVPSLWMLLAIVFFFGLSQSTAEVGANTAIVRLHHRNVGPYMNGLHFSFGVGAFISPMLLGLSLSRFGRLLPGFLLLSLLSLGVALWLFSMGRSRRSGSSRGPAEENRPAPPLLVLLLGLLLFLTIGGESSFGGWIFSYALQTGVAESVGAGYLTSIFWGALTLGRLVGIPVVHKIGPRYLLLANFVGCLIAAVAMVLWPLAPMIVWTAAIVLGFSMASIIPATFTLSGAHFTVSGRITGILVFFSAAGGMLLPWLIGQFFESIGPLILGRALLINQIIALMLFMLVFARSGKRAKDARM